MPKDPLQQREERRYRVLVVDREPAVRQVLGDLLSAVAQVATASTREECQQALRRRPTDLLVLGVGPGGEHDLAQRARALEPGLPVLRLIVAGTQGETSDETTKLLPADLLRSESGRAQLVVWVERLVTRARQDQQALFHRDQGARVASAGGNFFIGASAAVAHLRQEIALAASSDLNLLVTGETGVGKSLLARLIHFARADGRERPFVVVDPAALPPSLFESEVFGHAKGAYTGATTARMGAFEAADRGTLFLDEIGDLQPHLQVKLLRAVENKVVRRLGGQREIHLDVRVIAATNRRLEEEVSAGRFRADLYQRLNEHRLQVPPLRDRPEDVLPLLEHFMSELGIGRRAPLQISGKAKSMLSAYPWPGNVRELRNLARRIVERGPVDTISERTLISLLPARLDRGDQSDLSPEDRIATFSRRVYLDELAQRAFSMRETARTLGIPYATLRSRLKALGLVEVIKQKRGEPLP